jgi:VCBS repeat-containing protein
MAIALRHSYITRSVKVQSGVAVTVGDIIVVFLGGASSVNITSSCADNSSGGTNTYTKQTGTYGYLFTNAGMSIDVFTAKAKATETLTITVTSTLPTADDIAVQVISGAAASSYVESIAYQDCVSGGGTSFTGASITTTNANDYLACFWDADYNGVTWTENGAGFTIDSQSVTGVNSYRVVSSIGTYADKVTTGANTQEPACVMLAIKAAGSSYDATKMLACF